MLSVAASSKGVCILTAVALSLTGELLQVVQAKELEQQRKSQLKPGSKGAPAKAQVCSDSLCMLLCTANACTRIVLE